MTDTRLIMHCLEKRGIKQSNSGFMYLRELLELMNEDQRLHKYMYDYYDKLAQKFNTKPTSIERAIRYSIAHTGLSNKEFVYHLYNEMMCWTSTEKRMLQQIDRPPVMDSL